MVVRSLGGDVGRGHDVACRRLYTSLVLGILVRDRVGSRYCRDKYRVESLLVTTQRGGIVIAKFEATKWGDVKCVKPHVEH